MNKRKNYYIELWVFGIGFLVICFSLILIFKLAEFKDVLAFIASIVGGMVGGLLTLLGVQQTIVGQREQEALKLVPGKIVSLHKLNRKLETLQDTHYALFKEKSMNQIEEALLKIFNTDRETISTHEWYSIVEEQAAIINLAREGIWEIEEVVVKEEFKFIEIASTISIESYKRTIKFFDDYRRAYKRVLYSYSEWDVSYTMDGLDSKSLDNIEQITSDFSNDVYSAFQEYRKYLKEEELLKYEQSESL
ncbi:hypothetical protein [Bacillus cereus]|uniref:hypothetical protein n=1 Tax=Bacillus cereus TaxID=1396 RepID=UPI00077A2ECD|nr:hypothetical protein [Bacillus cereus]KXY61730.1 hypothetical protein AT275_17015 [Bacillus cereus]KXY62031.1 hypothetical protein AT275_18575 [Bacillus cereus]